MTSSSTSTTVDFLLQTGDGEEQRYVCMNLLMYTALVNARFILPVELELLSWDLVYFSVPVISILSMLTIHISTYCKISI